MSKNKDGRWKIIVEVCVCVCVCVCVRAAQRKEGHYSGAPPGTRQNFLWNFQSFVWWSALQYLAHRHREQVLKGCSSGRSRLRQCLHASRQTIRSGLFSSACLETACKSRSMCGSEIKLMKSSRRHSRLPLWSAAIFWTAATNSCKRFYYMVLKGWSEG